MSPRWSIDRPKHLHDLVDDTADDLDRVQCTQLSSVCHCYDALLPMPVLNLIGHADMIQHEIDAGDQFDALRARWHI